MSLRKLIDPFETLQSLHYCYKIIGLANIPTKEDEALLIEKLKQFHGNLKPSEIKLAFDFAIQKVFESDIEKHFHNFSVMYMNGILCKYSDYRAKEAVTIAHNRQIDHITTPESARKEFNDNIITPLFKDFQNGLKLNYGITPVSIIYNSLINESKYLEFSKEEKIQIRKDIEAEVIEIVPVVKSSSGVKSLAELLSNEQAEKTVVERCQIRCIELCFAYMVENEIEL